MTATQTLIQAQAPSPQVRIAPLEPARPQRDAHRPAHCRCGSSSTLLLIIVLYPLFWMIMGSFKTPTEFFDNPTWSLPETFNSRQLRRRLHARKRRG